MEVSPHVRARRARLAANGVCQTPRSPVLAALSVSIAQRWPNAPTRGGPGQDCPAPLVPNARGRAARIVRIMEHDDQIYVNTTFGERLLEERARLGLNQTEMAEAGGVKRFVQHLYERDIQIPDFAYLDRLRNLGADLSYLFLGVRQVNDVPDGFLVNGETLMNIHRVAFKVGVDAIGRLLPLEDRVTAFQLLYHYVKSDEPKSPILEALREQLVRFRSGDGLPSAC